MLASDLPVRVSAGLSLVQGSGSLGSSEFIETLAIDKKPAQSNVPYPKIIQFSHTILDVISH